jgi:hypothetical protein
LVTTGGSPVFPVTTAFIAEGLVSVFPIKPYFALSIKSPPFLTIIYFNNIFLFLQNYIKIEKAFKDFFSKNYIYGKY